MALDADPDGRQDGPLDAVLPEGMARQAERTGVTKARKDAITLIMLAALAGAFIAFGATFAALVGADGGGGPLRMLAGLAFSLAYVLAIVGGAELFTTNNLMIMAWAHGRLSAWEVLRAWGVVFVGNFLGVAGTGAMLVFAGVPEQLDAGVGASLLKQAERIHGLGFVEAFFLGTLGNMLLCLGVWLTYSGRTTTDRILALGPPVAAFYALGLEHAIAVMFYLPMAVFLDLFAGEAFWQGVSAPAVAVTPTGFLTVLGSVTLGNVVGGGGLVALVYWFIYLRPDHKA